MAGSFGFEADHYEVSLKCGERALLPGVREAEKSTLIVADGFSCREQIAQCTDRRALHTAEVLQLTIQQRSLPAEYPEQACPSQLAGLHWRSLATSAAVATLAVGLIGWWFLKRKD
jgi:hypothetical protein